MKILFIIPSYKPAYTYGGPIRSVSSLAESLVQAGHEVMVYTTVANGLDDLKVEQGITYLIEGVSVRYFNRWTKGHSNFSPSLLKAFQKDILYFDVVHIHSWWNLVTVPAMFICRLKGITPILSPRGSVSGYTFTHRRNKPKRLFHFLSGKKLLEQAIIHSTSVKEDLDIAQFIHNKKRYVIPNLLDLPDKVYGVHEESPYLKMIFLGRIDPAKNLELLFKVLTNDFPLPFQLNIIGEGHVEYAKKLKSFTSDHKEIKWLGGIDGIEKYKLLAESDILVLPSHTENYGNVVLESLSQGTPVLVSKNVGSKQYILEHRLGWEVDGNEKEWRNKIEEIWENKTERDEIRLRAPGCISNDFKKENLVKSYIRMYEENRRRVRIS